MGSAYDADFAEFFAARAPALRRTSFVIVHDWHAAEDVTQRTFVKLYRVWPRVATAGRDAYARRAVVNESLTHLRRRRPEVLTDAPPETAGPDLGDETSLDLVRALALLAPQQRAVVALRFVQDLSVRETADVLDIAEGTVKAHTSRALETLRQHLPGLIGAAPTTEETP